MDSKASVVWTGGLKDGSGRISTASGALKDIGYSFGTRFEGQPGTSPEELIGAAHAACFSMALSMQLGMAGFAPKNIETRATVSLVKVDDGFSINKVHLDCSASADGISAEQFAEIAAATKAGCPVSKVLKAEITLDARLV